MFCERRGLFKVRVSIKIYKKLFGFVSARGKLNFTARRTYLWRQLFLFLFFFFFILLLSCTSFTCIFSSFSSSLLVVEDNKKTGEVITFTYQSKKNVGENNLVYKIFDVFYASVRCLDDGNIVEEIIINEASLKTPLGGEKHGRGKSNLP